MPSEPGAHTDTPRSRPLGPGELSGGISVLLLLVAIFHGPALKNGFVYDDAWTIVSNPILRDPGNVLTLLGPGPARDLVPDAGRPVLLATEILDHALWGLSPRGYHAQSLLWHAAVVVLFFVGLARWTGGLLLSLMAAAAFAIHPINVEAVVAINYREDLLAAFFTLCALYAVIAARSVAGRGRAAILRVLAFVSVLLGCLGKENAMVAPLLLAALDACRDVGSLRATLRKRLADYVLLGVAAGAVFAWRAWVMGALAVVSRTAELTAAPGLPGASVAWSALALLRGLGQLVLPLRLSPEYPEPAASTGAQVMALAALVGLVALGTVALRLRRRHARTAFGILAGLLAYLPNIGLVPLTNVRADRYFYLPSMAFLLAICCLVFEALSRIGWFRRGTLFDLPRPWLAVGLMVAVLGARTLRQGRIWRSDLALWTYAVAAEPKASRAWSALASTHLRAGRTLEALEAAEKALQIADDGHVHHLIGVILMQQGANERAHAELERALLAGTTSDRGELLNNLGYCELRLKQYRQALARFAEAQRLAPRFDRPWLNAARAHQDLGDNDRALATLRQLVVRIPESIDGWKQLGFVLEHGGDAAGARKALERAAALTTADPEIERALSRLGTRPGP